MTPSMDETGEGIAAPGPMEAWFRAGNPHSEEDAFTFARQQDALRAALVARVAELEAALRDCQAVLQDIGYEAPMNGDPETQVRFRATAALAASTPAEEPWGCPECRSGFYRHLPDCSRAQAEVPQ